MISKESIKRFLMSLSEIELVEKWQFYFGDSGEEIWAMAEVDDVIHEAIENGSEDIVIIRLDKKHRYCNINRLGGFCSFDSIYDENSPFDIDLLTDTMIQEKNDNE